MLAFPHMVLLGDFCADCQFGLEHPFYFQVALVVFLVYGFRLAVVN
jgi:hypothetical protein